MPDNSWCWVPRDHNVSVHVKLNGLHLEWVTAYASFDDLTTEFAMRLRRLQHLGGRAAVEEYFADRDVWRVPDNQSDPPALAYNDLF